jgi:lipid kinase YegS
MVGRIHVVSSRRAVGDVSLDEALAWLADRADTTVSRTEVEQPGDARVLARKAAEDGADVVVAAGGDGTVNEVVTGLMEAGATAALAILPYGTANDFAASLGIDADPSAAHRDLVAGETTAIDAGRANGRWFVNVVAAGFGAQITAETPHEVKDVIGPLAYVGHALARLGEIRTPPVTITGPGVEWQGDCLGWIVGNGWQTGGGFRVCPEAELDDGELDLVAIPNLTAAEVLAIAASSAVSKTLDPSTRSLLTARVPWVRVQCAEGMAVNVDGEPLYAAGEPLDLTIEVVPRALRLIRPVRRQAAA